MFPDQLNGWKQIAAYLGKSVRAAQRWEEELGLPVHRIKTLAGQIVFARRSEIDAWTLTRDELPEASEPDAPAGPQRGQLAGSGVVAGALVLLAAIVALVAVTGGGRGDRTASRFRLDGTTLQGITDEGRLAWSIDFSEPVQGPSTEWRSSLRPIQRADMDGDGDSEAVVVVSKQDRASQEQVICVTADGRELWRYTPSLTLRFGEQTFDGPWPVRDVLVVPSGAAAGVWVALSHSVWWPGALVKIDERGTASLRFVQAGTIHALEVRPYEGRDVIVAAGVNNEHAGATIAVLNPDEPASSPQNPGSPFACRDCPAGHPLKYVVLPRSELNRLSRVPYNLATGMAVSGSAMVVTTTEWHEPGMGAMFTLDRSFAPAGVTMDDGYWYLHRRLEQSHVVTHDTQHCPDRRSRRIVRIWEPRHGWRETTTASISAAIPGV